MHEYNSSGFSQNDVTNYFKIIREEKKYVWTIITFQALYYRNTGLASLV